MEHSVDRVFVELGRAQKELGELRKENARLRELLHERNLGDLSDRNGYGHEYRVGDTFQTQYAAPGTGHCTYEIIRIDDSGTYWGVATEDTLRMLTERDVR